MAVPPAHVLELMEGELANHPQRLIRVVDYLLVSTNDSGGRLPAGARGSVQITDDVRLESVDHELAARLFEASSLRGENWRATPQYHAVHGYVSDVWAEGGEATVPADLSHWDDANRIWPVVQLSRLVRDNNVSTEHAVRRLIRADGTEQLIPFDGYESHVVYRLYPEREGWLDAQEAAALSHLATAYLDGPSLPGRVARALRQTESIAGERYLEDALPLVVSAFESLIKVGRQYLTAQFSQRVPAMAAEVGQTITRDECSDVYDDRSALVHGVGVDLSRPRELDEFGRRFNLLQETLRRLVRRAIEDREFAAVFSDDARIMERWPAAVTVRAEVEKHV